MTTATTIAVGFDGSPDAEAALSFALGLAHSTGADVAVVHAVGLLEHAAHKQTGELSDTVRRLSEEAELDPGSVRFVVSDGDPCSVLLRAVEPPISANILVVGTRGQGAHKGLLLGSTSHELAEHSTVPLVIVPVRP